MLTWREKLQFLHRRCMRALSSPEHDPISSEAERVESDFLRAIDEYIAAGRPGLSSHTQLEFDAVACGGVETPVDGQSDLGSSEGLERSE